MVFSLFTIFIVAGYVVIWFYWQGRNWARVLVLLTSLLCLYNLRYFFHSGIIMAKSKPAAAGPNPYSQFFFCFG